MTYQEILDKIVYQSWPLVEGDQDRKEAEWDEWLTTLRPECIDLFLEFLSNAPPVANEPMVAIGWNSSVRDCITACGKKAPRLVIGKLGPLLDNPNLRSEILLIFFSIESEQAIPWLQRLLSKGHLTPEELVYIRGTLDTIGNLESQNLIKKFYPSD